MDVVQAEMQSELVSTLKKRLRLYGASTAGKKVDLVDRLTGCMTAAPPDLGVGSFYHYNKKETVAKLEQFCKDNHIMVETGYVYIFIYVCIYLFLFSHGM